MRFTSLVRVALFTGTLSLLAVAQAATITVSNTLDSGAGSLRDAISTAGVGDTIAFSIPANSTITLTSGPLPIISQNLTIDGAGSSGLKIDGNGANRVFFVDSGNVTIQNLTIQNANATGGAGGNSAGGGLGAGAAIFVNSGANVTVDTVNFTNNQAVGGAGGNGANVSGGGGGGGFTGSGASSTANAGAGGGGYLGNGATAAFAGGGGGGVSANGAASVGLGGGGAGGTTAGTAGGAAHGGAGGTNGGGGGGSGGDTLGTAGIGGAGASAGTATTGGSGGSGVANGGGGGGGSAFTAGAGNVTGGAGGTAGVFGGGGGGGHASSAGGGTGTGGNGGAGNDFGGGGGAGAGLGAATSTGGTGGAGGFGGGGGAGAQGSTTNGTGGAAGFGGGTGSVANGANSGGGQGGSAFGGAIFVRAGGSLTIANSSASTSTATTGSALTAGAAGTAIGTGTSLGAGSATLNTNGSDLYTQAGVTTTISVTNAGVVVSDSGTIAGDGNLQKSGAGTFQLTNTGVVNVGGGTNVSAGTLQNNGTFLTALNIQSGATLTGTGTSAATTVSGTISPAGPGAIGTLSTGTYNQSLGSTYQVDITGNPTNTSDLIAVTGAATISGGTVAVTGAAGAYTVNTVYPILTATGGVTGTYDNLTTAGITNYFGKLVYQPNEVDFLYVSNLAGIAGNTPNENAVATTLDNIVNNGGMIPVGDLGVVLNQIYALPPNLVQNALDQISGAGFGSLESMRLQQQEAFRHTVIDRIRPLNAVECGSNTAQYMPVKRKNANDVPICLVNDWGEQCNCSDCCPPSMCWVDGIGGHGKAATDGNASGFKYSVGGTAFGHDCPLDEYLMVGYALGYANTQMSLSSVSQNITVDGYSAAAYVRHVFDCFYTLGSFGFTRDQIESQRHLVFGTIDRTARATFAGYEYSAYVEEGMLLCCGHGWKLQPYVAAQYINLQRDQFTETGADSLNLDILKSHTDSLRGIWGVRLESKFCLLEHTFVPMLHASYAREFLREGRFVSASLSGTPNSSFIVAGDALGRDFGTFGGGLSWVCNEHCQVVSAYDYTVSDRSSLHSANAGIQFTW